MKILIVEDEKYLRELYVEILEEAGYQVDQAKNGKEGYQKIFKGGFDLVLLDIILPEMDGVQILEKFHEIRKPIRLNKKIVMLTNLGAEQMATKCLSLGASGYLVKSDLNPGEFLDKVKEYLK